MIALCRSVSLWFVHKSMLQKCEANYIHYYFHIVCDWMELGICHLHEVNMYNTQFPYPLIHIIRSPWTLWPKFQCQIHIFVKRKDGQQMTVSPVLNTVFYWSIVFSSPEHEVLKWAFVIFQCPASGVRPCVNNFFKQHLLWNRLLDFDQTSQEWSLGSPLLKLFKPFQLVA